MPHRAWLTRRGRIVESFAGHLPVRSQPRTEGAVEGAADGEAAAVQHVVVTAGVYRRVHPIFDDTWRSAAGHAKPGRLSHCGAVVKLRPAG